MSLLLAFLCWETCATSTAFSQDSSSTVSVNITEEGVAVVQAQVNLDASPSLVFSVLTDYAHWPDLFPQKPVINSINTTENQTIVDMAVPVFFLPINFELVTATKEEAPDRIETHLVKGDFEAYAWVWEFTSSPDPDHTHATLSLSVKPAIWAPQWFLRWMIEKDIQEHLLMLQQKVLEIHQLKDQQNFRLDNP